MVKPSRSTLQADRYFDPEMLPTWRVSVASSASLRARRKHLPKAGSYQHAEIDTGRTPRPLR